MDGKARADVQTQISNTHFVKQTPYREPILKYTKHVYDRGMSSLSDPMNFDLHKSNIAKVVEPVLHPTLDYSRKTIDNATGYVQKQVNEFSKVNISNIMEANKRSLMPAESPFIIKQEHPRSVADMGSPHQKYTMLEVKPVMPRN